MSVPVTLGLLLPEPYTPLPTFTTEMARLDARIDTVATSQQAAIGTRLDNLEQQVATLLQEIVQMREAFASKNDLESASAGVQAATARISKIEGQLDGFSFRCGDVVAYNGQPPLEEKQLFLVVDSPEALQSLAETNSEVFQTTVFGMVFASS